MLWPRFIILQVHKSVLVVRAHCEVLTFHIL